MATNFTPDAKKHLQISLVKSGLRIAAGLVLCLLSPFLLKVAGVLLILAEVLGVVEELV